MNDNFQDFGELFLTDEVLIEAELLYGSKDY